jgi:hypothetical protein
LSAEETGQPGAPAGAGGGSDEPTEEELRAAYEAELSRITATDMMAQAAVSLLNIGARRLGMGGEGAGAAGESRDLEQVRDAVDGARALLEILERRIPKDLGPLRDALSRLQIAYAREVKAGAGAPGEAEPQAAAESAPAGAAGPAASQGEGAAEQGAGGEARPGPAEASGRLWVPGR